MAQSDIDALAIPKSPGDLHDYLERAVAAALRGSLGNVLTPLVDAPMTHDLLLRRGAGTITFTRAGTATHWDRYGVLQTAAADVPRFEAAGLLIEGASTNYVAYSEPSSAGQVYTSGGATFRAATLFAGAGFSREVYFPDATTDRYCYWAVTGLTVGQVYTQSVFVTTADGAAPVVSGSFDLTMHLDSVAVIPVVTRIGSSSIYRLSYTWTATATSAWFGVAKLIGSTYKALAVTGMQMELLRAASSYISTSGSAASRAADAVSLTVHALPPVNFSPVTVICDVLIRDTGGATAAVAVAVGGAAGFELYAQRGDNLATPNGNESVRAEYLTSAAAGGDSVFPAYAGGFRLAGRQSGSAISSWINGAKQAEIANSGTAVQTAPAVTIGSVSGGSYLFGHIRNLRIWDRSLSDTEIMTA